MSLGSADESILLGMEALNPDINDGALPNADDDIDENLSGLETELDEEPSMLEYESEDNLADVESLAPASSESVSLKEIRTVNILTLAFRSTAKLGPSQEG